MEAGWLVEVHSTWVATMSDNTQCLREYRYDLYIKEHKYKYSHGRIDSRITLQVLEYSYAQSLDYRIGPLTRLPPPDNLR